MMIVPRDDMVRMALDPETRLLLRTAGGPSQEEGIARGCAEPLDWGRFVRLASAERATTVVWQRLRRYVAGLPEAHLLEQAARASEFRLRIAERRLVEAVEALHDAGVVPVLLKGSAFAFAYGQGMVERPMHDADLLVRCDQVQTAERVLHAAGWAPGADLPPEATYAGHHHRPPLDDQRGSGLSIELHTALFVAGHPFAALDADAVRGRARPVRVGRATVLVPSPEDLLVHAAVHWVWSHMLRGAAWRTMRDVRVLLEQARPAWEVVAQRARTARAETCVYWTLRLARTLGGVEGVEDGEERTRPAVPEVVLGRLERHYAHAVVPDAEQPSVQLDAALWAMGVRPRASGHGRARPWTRDGLWMAARGESGDSGGLERMRQALAAGRYALEVALGR